MVDSNVKSIIEALKALLFSLSGSLFTERQKIRRHPSGVSFITPQDGQLRLFFDIKNRKEVNL